MYGLVWCVRGIKTDGNDIVVCAGFLVTLVTYLLDAIGAPQPAVYVVQVLPEGSVSKSCTCKSRMRTAASDCAELQKAE